MYIRTTTQNYNLFNGTTFMRDQPNSSALSVMYSNVKTIYLCRSNSNHMNIKNLYVFHLSKGWVE